MKSTGTILAATAAAVVAVMGATGTAQAGKKHLHIGIGGGHHGHHFHNHHFHSRHVFIGSSFHDGCGYEKRMWWKTGSYYWKKEYYLCKGWW